MTKIAAGDPETRSVDIVAENSEHLRALFPEAFTEGKVNFEGNYSGKLSTARPARAI